MLNAKGTLTFDMADPDSARDFLHAQSVGGILCALSNVSQHIREQLKYNDALSEGARKALEEVRALLYTELQHYAPGVEL